jgi:tetratricopeptide (TPR) repeat protein
VLELETDVKNHELAKAMRWRKALAYRDMGEAYLAMKEYSQAALEFGKALSLSSDFEAASLGMAVAECEMHGPEHAARALVKRTDDPLNLADAFAEIAAAYMCRDDWEKAMAVVDAGRKRKAEGWLLYHNWGLCLGHMGRLVAAAEAFRLAAESNSNGPQSLILLAQVYSDLGRDKEAVTTLKRTLRKFKNADVYARLSMLYCAMERFREAVKMGKIAVVLDPNDAQAQLMLGLSYIKLERYQEAKAPLRQASWLNPTQAMSLAFLALAYKETGDHDTSTRLLEKANEIDPGWEWTEGHKRGEE